MADDHRGGRGYPPRGNPEESHYPPPPNGDDDRRPPAHQQRPPAMTLPSMSYPYPNQPEQRYGDPRDPRDQRDPRYPPDARQPLDQRAWSSESPTNQNGYPPPPDGRYQLPPVQTAGERPRYDDRPPHDERRQYHDQQYYPHGPPPGPERGGPAYAPEYYQNRYPAPYQYGPGGPQAAQPPQQQAAPRQRTSIACRYCRKRKIRCSGYANTTNGKCTNCDKLRIECIFQPVSSNSSAAFVPVSAVPGGVPPGTPLYGAYGQPLPPAPGQGQQQGRAYPPPPTDYPPSLHSPNVQYYEDNRNPSRRRSRPPDEDHALRLPPPNFPNDDDPRRRSPASNHSNGTPPTAYRQYQQGPYEHPQGGYEHPQGGYEQGRTPPPHKNGPAGPPPLPAQSQPPPASQAASTSHPMSLGNIVDTHGRTPNATDIDRGMIGRLNRRP